MLYSDSPREMMQNAVNESFWDAHGVEIGPCADFPQKAGIRENLPGPGKKSRAEKIFSDSMLWVLLGPPSGATGVAVNFAGWAKMLENRAWPNLDAMSVPEALVYSILHHFARGIRIKHP